jgi:uncharacterized surface protein with fasciclin (FAS1) repeats
MRNSVMLLATVLALFTLVTTVSSCKKSSDNPDDTPAQPKAVTDIVAEDKNFTILNAALTYAKLGDALKGANLTVFAPTDAAFQAAGIATPAAISTLSTTAVAGILNYHVFNGATPAATFPTAINTPIQSKGGPVAYVTKTMSGTAAVLSINGARVTQADVPAANGVIHIIDKVLIPPTGSLLATAQADPTNFSLLLVAVNRVAVVNPTLAAALSSTANVASLTLFAPTNDAFVAAGYTTPASVSAASPATLSNILAYHAVAQSLFSTQLATGQLTTLNQSSTNKITIATSGTTITVKGNQNTTPANIKRADILTNNGIIHVIDQVLRP